MSPSYDKTHAVHDLVAIIHAAPAHASQDNPLCEPRLGKNGLYYRFPSKLAAMSRLIKLMGWNAPVKVECQQKDKFTLLLEETRSRWRRQSPPEAAPPSRAQSDTQTLAPQAQAEAVTDERLQAPLPSHADSTPAADSAADSRGEARTDGPPCYQKEDAVRDLATMMQTPPSEAGAAHPFSEMRITAWGSYYRLPSKLGAISLLARMMGWEQPAQVSIDLEGTAKFKALADFIRARH